MENIIAIILGTVSSVVATFIVWLLKSKIRDVLDTLDVSFHQLFTYMLILIILTVIIISHFMGKEQPEGLLGIFAYIVGAVVIYYFSHKK